MLSLLEMIYKQKTLHLTRATNIKCCHTPCGRAFDSKVCRLKPVFLSGGSAWRNPFGQAEERFRKPPSLHIAIRSHAPTPLSQQNHPNSLSFPPCHFSPFMNTLNHGILFLLSLIYRNIRTCFY